MNKKLLKKVKKDLWSMKCNPRVKNIPTLTQAKVLEAARILVRASNKTTNIA